MQIVLIEYTQSLPAALSDSSRPDLDGGLLLFGRAGVLGSCKVYDAGTVCAVYASTALEGKQNGTASKKTCHWFLML